MFSSSTVYAKKRKGAISDRISRKTKIVFVILIVLCSGILVGSVKVARKIRKRFRKKEIEENCSVPNNERDYEIRKDWKTFAKKLPLMKFGFGIKPIVLSAYRIRIRNKII